MLQSPRVRSHPVQTSGKRSLPIENALLMSVQGRDLAAKAMSEQPFNFITSAEVTSEDDTSLNYFEFDQNDKTISLYQLSLPDENGVSSLIPLEDISKVGSGASFLSKNRLANNSTQDDRMDISSMDCEEQRFLDESFETRKIHLTNNETSCPCSPLSNGVSSLIPLEDISKVGSGASFSPKNRLANNSIQDDRMDISSMDWEEQRFLDESFETRKIHLTNNETSCPCSPLSSGSFAEAEILGPAPANDCISECQAKQVLHDSPCAEDVGMDCKNIFSTNVNPFRPESSSSSPLTILSSNQSRSRDLGELKLGFGDAQNYEPMDEDQNGSQDDFSLSGFYVPGQQARNSLQSLNLGPAAAVVARMDQPIYEVNKKIDANAKPNSSQVAVITPSKRDVLFGKNKEQQGHNEDYVKRCKSCLNDYVCNKRRGPKCGKLSIIKRIISNIHNNDGRFLKLEKKDGVEYWVVVGTKEAEEKVSHCLRDMVDRQKKAKKATTKLQIKENKQRTYL